MNHHASPADLQFRTEFEAGTFPRASFDHRAHLRLAYTYLVESDDEMAFQRMRMAIFAFLQHHQIDPAKYHETLTRAWIMAVRHFMQHTAAGSCFDDLARLNPVMLDSKVMLTHYSAELLFSPAARSAFVTPDRQPIPRYGGS